MPEGCQHVLHGIAVPACNARPNRMPTTDQTPHRDKMHDHHIDCSIAVSTCRNPHFLLSWRIGGSDTRHNSICHNMSGLESSDVRPRSADLSGSMPDLLGFPAQELTSTPLVCMQAPLTSGAVTGSKASSYLQLAEDIAQTCHMFYTTQPSGQPGPCTHLMRGADRQGLPKSDCFRRLRRLHISECAVL
jgi:hypothetical protein